MQNFCAPRHAVLIIFINETAWEKLRAAYLRQRELLKAASSASVSLSQDSGCTDQVTTTFLKIIALATL